MKTLEALALEPHTSKFIEELIKLNPPPLYTLSVPEARKMLNELQSGEIFKLPADIEDMMIPGPKGDLSIRIVRPPNTKNKLLPIVMYFHGGGWILGNKDTHDRLIRELANGANAAIVFVNYTPSPEGQFPLPIEEAYSATKYFSEHGKEFNLDSSRLAVCGDSVGGNMAAVVCLLAKERGGPKIETQVLFYPVTDASFSTQSYQEFAEGPWLTKRAMEWFWDAYAPDVEERKNYLVSPLNATIEQLRDLPTALIITDENDVLRDEGEAYAHKLMQAKVTVFAIRFIGTIHDFAMLNSLAMTPATQEAIAMAYLRLQMAFTAK